MGSFVRLYIWRYFVLFVARSPDIILFPLPCTRIDCILSILLRSARMYIRVHICTRTHVNIQAKMHESVNIFKDIDDMKKKKKKYY